MAAAMYLILAASEVVFWVLVRGGIADYVHDFGGLLGDYKVLFLLRWRLRC